MSDIKTYTGENKQFTPYLTSSHTLHIEFTSTRSGRRTGFNITVSCNELSNALSGRLMDGASPAEGFLELPTQSGEWKRVCEDSLAKSVAGVICGELGYPGFKEISYENSTCASDRLEGTCTRAPRCNPSFCEELNDTTGGSWDSKITWFGSIVHLTCMNGYSLKGNRTLQCVPGSSPYFTIWNDSIPDCIMKVRRHTSHICTHTNAHTIGPTLFLLYINDIQDNIQSTMRLFTDDSTLYREIRRTEDLQVLEDDLQQLSRWSSNWMMDFNVKKCAILTITRKRTPSIREYHLSNGLIPGRESKSTRWDTLHTRRILDQCTVFYKIHHRLVSIPAPTIVIPATYLKHVIPLATIDSFKFSYYPRAVRIWNHLPGSAVNATGTTNFKEAALPSIRMMQPPVGFNII
eukprot:XP_011680608.1 PREDICTED: uncharacterized protein LOC105446017 [Strongylocentrotus purpuratus]